MIAVSFRHDGSVNTITCRWNHDNGGNDSIMTSEQVSKLIGADIYSIFNPDDIQNLVPEGVKVLKDNIEYGLKLCKNIATDDLYIYSYDFQDIACFNSKNYVVYNGKSDEGDISVLIDRNGYIYTVGYEENAIDTIENNGLLYVANPEFETGGQGIYVAKTMEKVKDISIVELNNFQNILILTNNEGYKLVIDKKTNKSIFNDYIDKIIYKKGKIVCFSDDTISVVNTDTCNIEINWSDIISTIGDGKNLLYLIQNENGMYIISKEFGLITNLPIEKTFDVQPAKGVPSECKYLIMCKTHGIALNQDKVYFSQVSSNDLKKVQELTTLTSIDIREIFNEIITYFD